jgi:hypothetical protein
VHSPAQEASEREWAATRARGHRIGTPGVRSLKQLLRLTQEHAQYLAEPRLIAAAEALFGGDGDGSTSVERTTSHPTFVRISCNVRTQRRPRHRFRVPIYTVVREARCRGKVTSPPVRVCARTRTCACKATVAGIGTQTGHITPPTPRTSHRRTLPVDRARRCCTSRPSSCSVTSARTEGARTCCRGRTCSTTTQPAVVCRVWSLTPTSKRCPASSSFVAQQAASLCRTAVRSVDCLSRPQSDWLRFPSVCEWLKPETALQGCGTLLPPTTPRSLGWGCSCDMPRGG